MNETSLFSLVLGLCINIMPVILESNFKGCLSLDRSK